ncbi:SPOR domain-containing protein [Agaribacterium haliotis]|uniref:SPOR domain-containing protein n=1 Tax=Agaribacterium haliotis TaxID=2013869 RepID=UPI000BB5802E|nr:SPOR domain-containing protein [Agaribacterium haliotis]
MNDGLKQRIVGALVLMALGIIFVPVIFDKERIVPVDRTTQIPQAPDIHALPLPEFPPAPARRDKIIDKKISGEFSAEENDADLPDVSTLKQPLGADNEADKAADKAKAESGSNTSQKISESKPNTDTSSEKPQSPEALAVQAKAEKSEAAAKAELDDRPVKNAQLWVLQLASFKDKARADKLKSDISAAGERAFVKTVPTQAGTRYRLYVGPSMNKKELQQSKIKLDKQYKLNSLLLRFKP